MLVIFDTDKFLRKIEDIIDLRINSKLAKLIGATTQFGIDEHNWKSRFWTKVDDLAVEVKSGRIDVLNTKKDVEVLLGGLRAQEVRDRKGL